MARVTHKELWTELSNSTCSDHSAKLWIYFGGLKTKLLQNNFLTRQFKKRKMRVAVKSEKNVKYVFLNIGWQWKNGTEKPVPETSRKSGPELETVYTSHTIRKVIGATSTEGSSSSSCDLNLHDQ